VPGGIMEADKDPINKEEPHAWATAARGHRRHPTGAA
jgi:hypothetical protein